MKLTFEYNDDESHLVRWSLLKMGGILQPNEKDPIQYKHKLIISNVSPVIHIKFDPKELIEQEIKKDLEMSKDDIDRYNYFSGGW